jgi:hypothetical protein
MPPSPPEGGNVIVHSYGYMYGHVCSTGKIKHFFKTEARERLGLFLVLKVV